VNPYAYGRLVAALQSAATDPDPAVRARAAGKADRWRTVLDGMASGALRVGDRTPVADTPAWVTLEVLHGGFATGAYLAEQPVTAAERAWLHPDQPGRTDRERVNLHFLGDAGQAELLAALATDRYRVELPEHAALAVVALLLDRGHPEAALDLVATLRPLLHRLRFTPTLLPRPEPTGSTVHLRTAGAVAAELRVAQPPPQLAAMRATLAANDRYDELVALWADTVEGEPPRLVQGWVVGGWPARRFPPDWAERRAAILAQEPPTTGRYAHPRGNYARLRAALEKDQLTGRDVGWVRRALANTTTRHPDRAALRRQQAAVLAEPTHAELARAVATGLDRYPPEEGVPTLDDLPAGTPPSVRTKVARALEAPVAELVRQHVLVSAEQLAEVLPQVTARHLAAGIADPVAAGLHARLYAAFRRRRTLLLLDLRSQVRFEELPWAAALDGFRTGAGQGLTEALRETVVLALTGFPATMLPNPLVSELSALARRAGLDLPLVPDVAADIFTGRFTGTWPAAAARASELLAGSPYGRYYDLPEAWPLPDPPRRRWQRPPPARTPEEAFAALCVERAAEAGAGDGGWVARNGAILEQASILTSANLAVLTGALGLGAGFGPLAGHAFSRAIVSVQHRLPTDGHARLITVKNAAYAWRQAVFFLGYADPAEREALVEQVIEWSAGGRLEPAARGLRFVLGGGRFAPDGTGPGGVRRFLGWSVGPHWVLA
jgi:hypothetical protein